VREFTVKSFEETIDAVIAAEKGSPLGAMLVKAKKTFLKKIEPDVETQIEVLEAIRKADLQPEEIDALLSIFIKDDDGLDSALLNDAINPGTLAGKLWGPRLMMNVWDNILYTRDYHEFPENNSMVRTPTDPKAKEKMEELTKNHDIPYAVVPFATGYDELYHHKLLRLATEFYNFDLSTEMGYLQFDLFLHAYEVSPGEDTLDRVHPIPTPNHTYDELPIIKFDGYDESDDPELHEKAEGEEHH